ncbi:MAG TPA: multiheme c-type cytochrome, partial [Polyangiales bacterium]|nr:multiheme c-type cytochrome [Polyangiales bacterium]
MTTRTLLVLALLVTGCASASGDSVPGTQVAQLSREQLLDPETCKGCHPQHYREWASSMHAYASEDPVFVAMNRRGQRETAGEMGDFCVQCHAPLALREGATFDGSNLADLPPKHRGVTCYFCHNAVNVSEPFNNHIELANDTTLRGAIADPVPNGAHASVYSRLQDRNRRESSQLCGSCHDVVTP